MHFSGQYFFYSLSLPYNKLGISPYLYIFYIQNKQ
jgi:hypothetical protein